MPSPKLKKKRKIPFDFGCGLILTDTKKLAIVFMFRTSQLLVSRFLSLGKYFFKKSLLGQVLQLAVSTLE